MPIKKLKSKNLGFTLIELLVAISILAIIGVLLFVDFGPFRKDQALLTATNNIQSFIRSAQTNATAGVLCSGTGESTLRSGSAWSLKFSPTNSSIQIVCEKTQEIEKMLKLQDNIRYEIKCADNEVGLDSDTSNCADIADDFVITFSPIYGKVCFVDSNQQGCLDERPVRPVKFAKIKVISGNDSKGVIINLGGLVYVQ